MDDLWYADQLEALERGRLLRDRGYELRALARATRDRSRSILTAKRTPNDQMAQAEGSGIFEPLTG